MEVQGNLIGLARYNKIAGSVVAIQPALIVLTSLYLTLPSFILLVTWFRWEIGIPVLVLGLYLCAKNISIALETQPRLHISVISLIKLLCIAVAITYFSGIGGYSLQSYDYWGHNTKLQELADKDWPLTVAGLDTFVCYYFGYYVVPALLGKLFHGHLNFFMTSWAGAGIYLIVIWFFLLFGRKLGPLFVFTLLGSPLVLLNALPFYNEIIIQTRRLYFHGFLQGMLWQPHQCIPAALLAAIIIHFTLRRLGYNLPIFLGLACIAWGPFVSLGCLSVLFLNLSLKSVRNRQITCLTSSINSSNVLSIIYSVPLIFYFLSSGSTSGIQTIVRETPNWQLYYLTFITFNVAIYVFISSFTFKINHPLSLLVITSFAHLCFLALFKMGVYNDLVCKSSLTALFIIYFYITKLFYRFRKMNISSRKKAILVAAFTISMISTMNLMKGQFENNTVVQILTNRNFPKIPHNQYESTYKMLKEKHSQAEANQYLGNKESFYGKYLAPR